MRNNAEVKPVSMEGGKSIKQCLRAKFGEKDIQQIKPLNSVESFLCSNEDLQPPTLRQRLHDSVAAPPLEFDPLALDWSDWSLEISSRKMHTKCFARIFSSALPLIKRHQVLNC